jgi:hypothetical protein
LGLRKRQNYEKKRKKKGKIKKRPSAFSPLYMHSPEEKNSSAFQDHKQIFSLRKHVRRKWRDVTSRNSSYA